MWFTTVGVVFILLGLVLQFIEQQQLKIPKKIGWGFCLVAIIGGLLLPFSGFWALLLPGAQILLSNN
ncbi:MAG: DUF6463 family protein [Aureispira sp.]